MSELPPADYTGKVRNLYFLDEQTMLIQATDRVSAFDVVFPEKITGKGKTLNHISGLWFNEIEKCGLQNKYSFYNHLLTTQRAEFPAPFNDFSELEGCSALVRRTKRIDFECVVRGYLTGSGWKDYQQSGSICGIKLPAGLQNASQLPEPIFTPATKAAIGDHDQNVSFASMQSALGMELADRLKTISIAIYKHAAKKMLGAGIILCDTKFEFGILDDKVYLIDEVLTPDSSRYWKSTDYREGTTPPGYDKQFIRDYAESTGWNKTAPAPNLPQSVIEKTQALYREIESQIENLLTAV
ncbi:MAG: phosphoribosylaminoimidazolesuccinocarboxamide synthase [Leptospiraceae bacterium]|nr:phosphoribosylaminoimidazolesuccinocarboxamide synthase [Leptospiraceae bacterium]